ncbi:hypothetical protein SARC_04282 [Sphaeroforma arctica JP610]|uniref:RGS domain-containing protein n=1 Tax=Sphaeroforma arctica JP610 TaxID=667725 RepID=A0A0L0G5D8_9EUKA|nr:hypothetical protein SARC_04282 [Sphaeroforma arctica JP610]KNC83473.1 hypothetical protein SARC_04282 [Sphaeroforma arctica JP610]|eukprot:XP_014157375.1 hypothetical protein SARC_04282 [Sphaeroforma arctica JP610]
MYAPFLTPSRPPEVSSGKSADILSYVYHLTRRFAADDTDQDTYVQTNEHFDYRSGTTSTHTQESYECETFVDHEQYWTSLSRMIWFIIGVTALIVFRKWEPLVHRSYAMPFVISAWFILDGFIFTMCAIDADWVCSYPSMLIRWLGIYMVGPVYCLYLWHQTLAYKLALMNVQYATNIPQIEINLPANWQSSIARQILLHKDQDCDVFDVSGSSEHWKEIIRRQRARTTTSDRTVGYSSTGSKIFQGLSRSPPLRRSHRNKRPYLSQSVKEDGKWAASGAKSDVDAEEGDGNTNRKRSLVHRTMSDAAVYFDKRKHLARSMSRQRSYECDRRGEYAHNVLSLTPQTSPTIDGSTSGRGGDSKETVIRRKGGLYNSNGASQCGTMSVNSGCTRPDRSPDVAHRLSVPANAAGVVNCGCPACGRVNVCIGDSFVCECGMAGGAWSEEAEGNRGKEEGGGSQLGSGAYKYDGATAHTNKHRHTNVIADTHASTNAEGDGAQMGDSKTMDTSLSGEYVGTKPANSCHKHTCRDTCTCENNARVNVKVESLSMVELPQSRRPVSMSDCEHRDSDKKSISFMDDNHTGQTSTDPGKHQQDKHRPNQPYQIQTEGQGEIRSSMARSDFSTTYGSPRDRDIGTMWDHESSMDIVLAGEEYEDGNHNDGDHEHEDESETVSEPKHAQVNAYNPSDSSIAALSRESYVVEVTDSDEIDPDAPWLMRHWQWLMNWATVAAFTTIAGTLHFLPMFFVVDAEAVAQSTQERCLETRITDPSLCLTHTGQQINNYMFFVYLLIVVVSAVPYIAIVKDGYFQSVTTYTYMVCMGVDVVVNLNTVMDFWSSSDNSIGTYVMDLSYSLPLLVVPVMMALWMHYFLFNPDLGDIFGPMGNFGDIHMLNQTELHELAIKANGEGYHDSSHSDVDQANGIALMGRSAVGLGLGNMQTGQGSSGMGNRSSMSASRTSIHSVPMFTSGPPSAESRKGSYISTSHSVKTTTSSINSTTNIGPTASMSGNSLGHSILLAGSLCAAKTLEEDIGSSDDYDRELDKSALEGPNYTTKRSLSEETPASIRNPSQDSQETGEAYDHMGVGLETSTLNFPAVRTRGQGPLRDMHAQESTLALGSDEIEDGGVQDDGEEDKHMGVVHRFVEAIKRPFRSGFDASGGRHTHLGASKHIHIPHVLIHGSRGNEDRGDHQTAESSLYRPRVGVDTSHGAVKELPTPDGVSHFGTGTNINVNTNSNTTTCTDTNTNTIMGRRDFLRTKESLLVDQALRTPPVQPQITNNHTTNHTHNGSKRERLRQTMARISDWGTHSPHTARRFARTSASSNTPQYDGNDTIASPNMNANPNVNWNMHGAASQNFVLGANERVLSSSLTVLPAARFNLELVLSDPILRQALLEYSVSCWNSENLLCYEAIIEFENMLNNTTVFNATSSSLERVLALGYTMGGMGQLAWPIAQVTEQVEAKAKLIYKNFIAPNAIMSVNISHEARGRLIKVFSDAQALKASVPQLARIKGSKPNSSSGSVVEARPTSNQIDSVDRTPIDRTPSSIAGTPTVKPKRNSLDHTDSSTSNMGDAGTHTNSNSTTITNNSVSSSKGLGVSSPRNPLLNSKLFSEVKEIVGDFLLNTIRFGFRSSSQFKKCLDAYRKRREALMRQRQGLS